MKAFVENNKIFITPEDNLIPQCAISIDIPDGTQPDELEWDGKELRVKDKEQYLSEKKEKLKAKAHEININEYVEKCKTNDNEIMKYNKRKELGIDTEDDINDYNKALAEYEQITKEYQAQKEKINEMTIEELENYINEKWGII